MSHYLELRSQILCLAAERISTSDVSHTTSAIIIKPARCYKLNNSEVVVKVNLPGVEQDDITIKIGNQRLAIITSGINFSLLELDGGKCKNVHRSQLTYSLGLRFPRNVHFNGVSRAIYKDGVLLLKIPFRIEERTR